MTTISNNTPNVTFIQNTAKTAGQIVKDYLNEKALLQQEADLLETESTETIPPETEPEETQPEMLPYKGDINNDGTVNALDAVEILKEAVSVNAGNESILTEEQKLSADLDADTDFCK